MFIHVFLLSIVRTGGTCPLRVESEVLAGIKIKIEIVQLLPHERGPGPVPVHTVLYLTAEEPEQVTHQPEALRGGTVRVGEWRAVVVLECYLQILGRQDQNTPSSQASDCRLENTQWPCGCIRGLFVVTKVNLQRMSQVRKRDAMGRPFPPGRRGLPNSGVSSTNDQNKEDSVQH